MNGRAGLYLPLQVELLHFLLTVADSNEGAGLGLLLRAALSLHLFLLLLPATAHQVDTWRRAEEPRNAFRWVCTRITHLLLHIMQPLHVCACLHSCTDSKSIRLKKNTQLTFFRCHTISVQL